MNPPATEFNRRLALVRRIARLNSRRVTFSHEEELQFIVAASLFTIAELERLLDDAPPASSEPSASAGAR